jgi:predicted dehydrogenase
MSVRIGVIGVGYLGKHHARIYSELEEADLVAVADINTSRAEDIAKTYGCKAFSNHAEIMKECDALSIVTPTITHHVIAKDCLSAGKDILIEKPITENVDEARDIIEVAEKKDVILQIGHIERYNQGIIAASEMIREPRFIESERLSPFLGRGTDVDVTLDLMIHDIDIVMSIVQSRLKDIRATGAAVLTDKLDVAKVWLEFENGCKALMKTVARH